MKEDTPTRSVYGGELRLRIDFLKSLESAFLVSPMHRVLTRARILTCTADVPWMYRYLAPRVLAKNLRTRRRPGQLWRCAPESESAVASWPAAPIGIESSMRAPGPDLPPGARSALRLRRSPAAGSGARRRGGFELLQFAAPGRAARQLADRGSAAALAALLSDLGAGPPGRESMDPLTCLSCSS